MGVTLHKCDNKKKALEEKGNAYKVGVQQREFYF